MDENVIFNYRDHNNLLRKTEGVFSCWNWFYFLIFFTFSVIGIAFRFLCYSAVTRHFSCPFCLVRCGSFKVCMKLFLDLIRSNIMCCLCFLWCCRYIANILCMGKERELILIIMTMFCKLFYASPNGTEGCLKCNKRTSQWLPNLEAFSPSTIRLKLPIPV